jgi:hypothetical protein
MLLMTTYRIKSHLDKSDVAEMMDIFGKAGGKGPGAIAHYVRADASGGWTVSDIDDLTAIYTYLLPFTEFLEFETTPIQKIDDAVGPILAFLGDD